ncbi:MAG: thioredoxin-disulfide reductase [Thermodesulfobacteriota bacterium]
MTQTAYDLIIIGAGPAGLTAGLYAGRAKLSVLVLEKAAPGGQILVSDWIENYPGFPEGRSGADLMADMLAQARRFGVEIQSADVVALDVAGAVKQVHVSDTTLTAKSVIIATGASPRKLGVPGEDQYYGQGVSTCATCDAPFFKDSVVAAVGGGDTAVQESIFLTKFAKKVYLIHRRDQLRATRVLQDRAFENEKIEILWDSVVTEIKGGNAGVEAVTVKNVKTGDSRDLSVDGCFMWVGVVPNTAFAEGAVDRNDAGFILADQRMQTSVPGVYAAGDVRDTPLRQVATAVGDGAIAAFEAANYIETLE